MKDWTIVHAPAAQHVMPNDDLILHTESTACPCAPTVYRIGYDSCAPGGHRLAIRLQVAHNAMDGRE